jgi:adenylate cyclase
MTRSTDEKWKAILTGEISGLPRVRRIFSAIPSSPRCKLCSAPFGAPGSLLLSFTGYRQSPLNRRLCRMCIRGAHKEPGGAEVEITVLFVDVRGSTGVAEHVAAEEYSRLIARLYGTTARIVDDHDGIVDKFVGDGAVALFIPGFTGTEHATAAVAAARELARAATDDDESLRLPIGIGVHTGISYVGTIGEGDALDFTALGDTVNIASRVTAAAHAGEILVTGATAKAVGLDTTPLEQRTLALRGRSESVEAWVLRQAPEHQEELIGG